MPSIDGEEPGRSYSLRAVAVPRALEGQRQRLVARSRPVQPLAGHVRETEIMSLPTSSAISIRSRQAHDGALASVSMLSVTDVLGTEQSTSRALPPGTAPVLRLLAPRCLSEASEHHQHVVLGRGTRARRGRGIYWGHGRHRRRQVSSA